MSTKFADSLNRFFGLASIQALASSLASSLVEYHDFVSTRVAESEVCAAVLARAVGQDGREADDAAPLPPTPGFLPWSCLGLDGENAVLARERANRNGDEWPMFDARKPATPVRLAPCHA